MSERDKEMASLKRQLTIAKQELSVAEYNRDALQAEVSKLSAQLNGEKRTPREESLEKERDAALQRVEKEKVRSDAYLQVIRILSDSEPEGRLPFPLGRRPF